MALSPNLEAVQTFWNTHPCGAHFINAPFATAEFFRRYDEFRYQSEWHLSDLVPFAQYRGKHVLEVGCGLGADGSRFAQNGAIYTGIDLTPTAVEATRLHFEALGLSGSFLLQNAEHMTDFGDQTFDLVYSHGVLHHTQNLSNTLQEIHRVLKPNGEILIMLYHRRSFNYYVRILGYLRLQVLAYILRRPFLSDQQRTGNLELHYQNYKKIGARYFSTKHFPHHCTDGPECPIAYSYTKAEITRMFSPYFSNLRFAVAHLPIHNTFPIISYKVERFLAAKLGWYLFIYGTKLETKSGTKLNS